jgi:uncharacterized coiled-coil protein SlyX
MESKQYKTMATKEREMIEKLTEQIEARFVCDETHIESHTELLDKLTERVEAMEEKNQGDIVGWRGWAARAITEAQQRLHDIENPNGPALSGPYPEQQGGYLCAQCDRPIPDCTCGAWYQPVKVEHREPVKHGSKCLNCGHINFHDCCDLPSLEYYREPAPESMKDLDPVIQEIVNENIGDLIEPAPEAEKPHTCSDCGTDYNGDIENCPKCYSKTDDIITPELQNRLAEQGKRLDVLGEQIEAMPDEAQGMERANGHDPDNPRPDPIEALIAAEAEVERLKGEYECFKESRLRDTLAYEEEIKTLRAKVEEFGAGLVAIDETITNHNSCLTEYGKIKKIKAVIDAIEANMDATPDAQEADE